MDARGLAGVPYIPAGKDQMTNDDMRNELKNEPEKRTRPEPLYIHEKFTEMFAYGYRLACKFDRRQKELGDEIRACMLRIDRLIIRLEKSHVKKTTTEDIDVEISLLQDLVNLAAEPDFYHVYQDKNFKPALNKHQKEVWSRKIAEIGRMVGGYIKSLREQHVRFNKGPD
jgi:hypothetical protein